MKIQDTEAFVKMLLKPPAPSKKLKRAAMRYKKVMEESVTEKGVADPRFQKIEPLGKKHNRVVFSGGNDAL